MILDVAISVRACPSLNKIRKNYLQNDRDADPKMMFERNVRWTA